MSKIDELMLAQGRIEQKLDDLIGTSQSRNDEQRVICGKQFEAIEAVKSRVDGLEKWRTYLAGAWAVVALLGWCAWDYITQRGNK